MESIVFYCLSENTMTSRDIETTSTKGYLNLPDDSTITYHRTYGKPPGVVFLTGFRSDMQGNKALAVENFCKINDQAFVRFDYFGHGESSGKFEHGSISRWLEDTITVIDELTKGPQILVGSSMGGWLMLLAALQRKKRVAGLIGIAAAPDFTEDLIKPNLSANQLLDVHKLGYCEVPNNYDEVPYIVTKELLEDGKHHLLLRSKISLNIPLRLLHGIEDRDVPWQTALRIMEKFGGDDVEIHYSKNSDHSLSTDRDLKRIFSILERLLKIEN